MTEWLKSCMEFWTVLKAHCECKKDKFKTDKNCTPLDKYLTSKSDELFAGWRSVLPTDMLSWTNSLNVESITRNNILKGQYKRI